MQFLKNETALLFTAHYFSDEFSDDKESEAMKMATAKIYGSRVLELLLRRAHTLLEYIAFLLGLERVWDHPNESKSSFLTIKSLDENKSHANVTGFYDSYKNIITYIFGVGRHDGGTATYVQLDTNTDTLLTASEIKIPYSPKDAPCSTVKSITYNSRNYFLITGDQGNDGRIADTELWRFEETTHPTFKYICKFDFNDTRGSAFIRPSRVFGEKLKQPGTPVILILGATIDFYQADDCNLHSWTKVKSVKQYSSGKAYRDAALIKDKCCNEYVVVADRSAWNNGRPSGAPVIFIDMSVSNVDEAITTLECKCQGVAVADISTIFPGYAYIGNGGEYSIGQPNFAINVNNDKKFLIPAMHTDHCSAVLVDDPCPTYLDPTCVNHCYSNTATRAFSVYLKGSAIHILVVNMGAKQESYVINIHERNDITVTTLKLPDKTDAESYPIGGDIKMIGEITYVAITYYLGETYVYKY